MIDLKSIGSEQGVYIIAAFLFFKDVFIPLWKKVIIPRWAKLVGKNPGSPSATQLLNPNSVTLAKVCQALKDHEKHDKERTDEIKGDIKALEKGFAKCGERLAGLESRSL